MTEETIIRPYPAQLLNWAGHRSGGVRRLFDGSSGRPGGITFQTNLLHRLKYWAGSIASGQQAVPRILLLVGGPGNGKTEAIEATVGWLDEALGAKGGLNNLLKRSFLPSNGAAVPRLVCIDVHAERLSSRPLKLSLVQDASAVVDAGGMQASRLFLNELETIQSKGAEEVYLCCVNRGILDDALIEAIDTQRSGVRRLLEAVTRAVSLAPDAPSCWPLAGFPQVAVWPMDAESLLRPPEAGGEAPARSLLRTALDDQKWPELGSCAAGSLCPFCRSREHLSRDREQTSLLQILRWFEVASGKRWSFRDLFSLTSYLLAGPTVTTRGAISNPCEWAAKLVQEDKTAQRGGKPSKEQSTAIFFLVSALYQHALFHKWDRDAGPSLLRDLRELGLEDDNTAMGLHWFLSSRRNSYLPAMISSSLDLVAELLDPALADPNTEVQVSSSHRFALREIDVRFSRSVREGLEFTKKHRLLSRLEFELLERLARLDADLSIGSIRRKRPAAASNVQRFIRDFAGRLTRRSLGTKTASVLDAVILTEFQRVVEDDAGDDLYDVAQEVRQLLNNKQDFEISLTTTFGQPLPPLIRRATLVVPTRPVQPLETNRDGRPASPIRFLRVGDSKSTQPIALTYDLFKAVKELEEGMSVASLPRSVHALLDTTRARLSGPIVRDRLVLDQARIRIGTSGQEVLQRRTGFVARKESNSR